MHSLRPLSFSKLQVLQFLKYEKNSIISPPFITDIFLLDIMCEMLGIPLYFLSYLDRRTEYSEKLIAQNELVIFSYHLKRNLWIGDFDFISFEETIRIELDLAMLARREGASGESVPKGILTTFKGTMLESLLSKIESSGDSTLIDFSLLLLSINERSLFLLNKNLKEIKKVSRTQKGKDFSLSFKKANVGLTIYCDNSFNPHTIHRLQKYCELIKYVEKVDNWFGLYLGPNDLFPFYSFKLYSKWQKSSELDSTVKHFKNNQARKKNKEKDVKNKIGRNDPCPCGSAKKYKKCCISI